MLTSHSSQHETARHFWKRFNQAIIGSHIYPRHPTKQPLTVPDHKELDRGTLKRILKDADVKTETLTELI